MNHNYEHGPVRAPTSGRIRHAIARVGILSLAVSAVASLNAKSTPVQIETTPDLSSLLVQEATIPHYARSVGIGEAMAERDIPVPERLRVKLDSALEKVAAARNDETVRGIDLNISAGHLAYEEGGWDPARLEGYLDRIDLTGKEIADTHDFMLGRLSETIPQDQARRVAWNVMARIIDADAPLFVPSVIGFGESVLVSEIREVTSSLMSDIGAFAYLPPDSLTTLGLVCDKGPVAEVCSMPIEDPDL